MMFQLVLQYGSLQEVLKISLYPGKNNLTIKINKIIGLNLIKLK
jgi:hypothetical protein